MQQPRIGFVSLGCPKNQEANKEQKTNNQIN